MIYEFRAAVEIERTFYVEDVVELPTLTGFPGVKDVDEPLEQRLEAEYFDTEDLRLASRKITLRRWIEGEDADWYLELPAGADEYHAPLTRVSDGVPKALLQRVRVHTRDSALVPVARLSTRHIVHRLRGDNGNALVDFTELDRLPPFLRGPRQQRQGGSPALVLTDRCL